MHPSKVVRERVTELTDLPNVGPVTASDLRRIGITRPAQLEGADPFELYVRLCRAFGERQDPCLLDVLMSLVDFADGGDPKPWWHYTRERKRRYAGRLKVR